MALPLPPSGQPRPPESRPTDPPSLSRRGMPTLPEPQSRRETALIWIQTVLLGLLCTGILVMYHKIMDPKTLGVKIAPLFANLFGASLLVAVLQLIRGKAWPWLAVGMVILVLACGGMWLTMSIVPHLGIKAG